MAVSSPRKGARKTGKGARRDKSSTVSRDSSLYRKQALIRATNSLLNGSVVSVEYPGGRSRESYRMLLDSGASVIATRRSTLARARREVAILGALNRHDAPVPALLGTNHSQTLIQEEIYGQRLSLALKDANADEYFALISSALASLASIQVAATAEGLEAEVSLLGADPKWILNLIGRPGILGKHLGVVAPRLDKVALVDRLRVDTGSFIKWDARPGNALVTALGDVVWFDWEHAGKRHRLDDVAWVLGDEFLPDHPEKEASLINEMLPRFANGRSAADAFDYLMCYGTFHMIVRLGLILKYMTGRWWDLDECIANDKVGVTRECAERLRLRGARWSRQSTLTEPLHDWFERIGPALDAL